MTKNNDTALLPIPKNREIWTFSEAEKLCAWYSENFETISLVLHNARPTAPQNAPALVCKNHPNKPKRENLDGDDLCIECCVAWAKAEGKSHDQQ